MHQYYVNKKAQTNGVHEVHRLGCRFLPKAEHRINIGPFNNVQEALKEALKTHPTAKGCPSCLDFDMRWKNKKTGRIS
jgi:hypothetical protein